MNWAGRSGYKGLSYQSWAALSLFLQHLREANFSHIQVEAPKFQDFNLVFNDGRKLVCEAKDRAGAFGFAALKELLNDLLSKQVRMDEEDQIVVIATKIAQDLKRTIKVLRYVTGEHLKELMDRQSLQPEHVSLLPKIVLWEAKKEENIKISLLLFAELLDCWLPEEDLEEALLTILWKEFFERTVDGKTFTRQELLDRIKEKQSRIIRNAGDERKAVLSELDRLRKALADSNDEYWTNFKLSSLGLRPNILAYALSYFEGRNDLVLHEWDFLWNALPIYRYSHALIKVFAQNTSTVENQQYALKFLAKGFSQADSYYFSNFYDVNAFELLQAILKRNQALNTEIFAVASEILRREGAPLFFGKRRQDLRYRKEKFADLLSSLFQSGGHELQPKVIELVYDTFNLVEDDGEYWNLTPPKIYEVIHQFICQDWSTFEKRFLELVSQLSSQFTRTYKATSKKLKFKGWEHWGGMTSGWGGHLQTKDRFFLQSAIIPSLNEYYKVDRDRAWEFVKQHCLSKADAPTSKKPDFLQRAAIPILLQEYRKGGVNSEGFSFLKSFLVSKKSGLKRDLILQSLLNGFDPELIWPLLEAVNKLQTLPVSSYQEILIERLASQGHHDALKIASDWIENPQYLEKPSILGNKATEILHSVLRTDPTRGVSIFRGLIGSEVFRTKTHWFDIFDWAKLLNDILHYDFVSGLLILQDIASKEALTDNEQILLMNALIKSDDKESSDAAEVLSKLFNQFVSPLLAKFEHDATKIAVLIPSQNPREQFIEFAERLIKNTHVEKGIEKALVIAKSFLNDPSPGPSNPQNEIDDPHEKLLSGSEVSSIETVRGRLAWLLMNCCTRTGKGYFKGIVSLIEALLLDNNYYVRRMACYSLGQLIKVRYAYTDQSAVSPLLGDSEEEAIALAKKAEGLCFNFLSSLKSLEQPVQPILGKALLHAFESLRTIDFDRALLFLNEIKLLPDEVIAEAIPNVLFFAEFRKKVFPPDWKIANRMIQTTISYDFDSSPFETALLQFCRSGSETVRRAIAWHVMKVGGEAEDEGATGIQHKPIVMKYFDAIIERYDHESFNSIYMLAWDKIQEDFDTSFELWKKCVKTERVALCELSKKSDMSEARWWPFSFSSDILALAYEKGRKEEFLEYLHELLLYPEQAYLGFNDRIVEILESMDSTKESIDPVFKLYVEKNPTRFERYVQWKESHRPAP